MRQIATDVLLAVPTLAIWFAALGFMRLRQPLDRLHAASFAGIVSGPMLVVAALVAQGPTGSVLKVLFIAVVLMLSGAALSHAVGRAIHVRNRGGAGSL